MQLSLDPERCGYGVLEFSSEADPNCIVVVDPELLLFGDPSWGNGYPAITCL